MRRFLLTRKASALVPHGRGQPNFFKITRLANEAGHAVIPKNSPRHVVVNFEKYDELQAARAAHKQKIEATTDPLIKENLEALQELAK